MMKGLKKRICAVGLAVASVFAGVAVPIAVSTSNIELVEAADDYPTKYKNAGLDQIVDEWKFYNRECTSFAAWCLNSRNGVAFNNYYQGVHWGDAKNWGTAARKVGITVDNNPKKGSIYWQVSGEHGHVAWVKEVSGDKVYCEWYNTNRDGKYHEGWLNKSSASGYIHIKDINYVPPINNYWPLADGYYTIKTAVGNRFLDVSGMGTADRTNVQIWDAFGAHSGQIFKIGRNGNSTGYYIQNINSGTFVDTTYPGDNGKNVMIYHGDGTYGQQWIFENAGNGNYFIRNITEYHTYLDVANGVNANGTNVSAVVKNGSAAQQWKFTRVSGKNLANIADGDYMIYSKVGNKVLNAAGDRTSNGTNLQIWDPLEVSGNVYTVSKDGRFVTKIKNKAANRMVDSQGGTNAPENVNLWDYNNGYGQNWYVEDAGDGYVYIRNLWGYYLDVANAVNANGTNVNTWHFNGSDAQKWKFVKFNKVLVNGVSLNKTKANVNVGKTVKLTATITPSDATNKNVIWSSSNTQVATVDSNGNVKGIKPGTATITAKTESGGKTAKATVTVLFNDVKTGSSFSKAIYWAANNGITTGAGKNTFKPNEPCTRGQVMAFIWRIAGSPSTKSSKSKLKDINNKAKFYKSSLWGVNNKIIEGYPNNTFRENVKCSRGHIVAFLWRYAGSPEPKTKKSPFKDVNKKSTFYKAILWASENGITTGYKDGTFKSKKTCTRGQTVAFLERFAKKYPGKVKL